MKENVKKVKLPDGQIAYETNLEFESEQEADNLLSDLRKGLSIEDAKESEFYFSKEENKQKFATVFAHTWVLINIARQANSLKDFEIFLKHNDVFFKQFEITDKEILKIIIVFVDIIAKVRVRKYINTKELKKRLIPVKNKLKEELPSDFEYYPLKNIPELLIN